MLQSAPVRLVVLVFGSGFAGLVYQLLWMRQLSFLFGNTSQAASITLAVFFAGLAVGSWWWGRRMHRQGNPLQQYAYLEFGIAGTALVYFVLLFLFQSAYAWIYQSVPGSTALLGVKIGFSLLLVFPPAFFMGGTIPVLGQAAVQDASQFGWKSSALYGVNTLGAGAGVAAVAFLFIPALGFRLSYTVAILISLSLGALAWSGSRRMADPPHSAIELSKQPVDEMEAVSKWGKKALGMLCFFSGFVVLALEVIWMRVFAQVHENSVYAFAIILIVVLVGLALGASLSAVLARITRHPIRVLGQLALLGGLFLVAGPSLLMWATHGLQPVHALDDWSIYVVDLFKMAFTGLGPMVIALGMVFPFLLKVAERGVQLPGRTLGWMLSLNTLGAILGSLLSGFLFLPWLGMWGSFRVLTVVYLLVALLIPMGWARNAVIARAIGLLALLLSLTWLDPSDLPVLGIRPGTVPGTVLEVWEESDATISVVERPSGHRVIMLNSGYSLGSTAVYREQADQSRIPLYLFPETESICFIGMGTGISAGASLGEKFPRVQRVVSCELSPAVVEAARKWIPDLLTGGLFHDSRSTILIEDGRHYLMATDERFDMINADLFLPYRRGTGSLYSLDHYESVAKRLNPGGVFVQWLPLYQITSDEFGVIVRTMLEAFEQVTLWRNNFAPGQEKVALIGQLDSAPLPLTPSGDRDAMLGAVDGLRRTQAHPDMVRAEAKSIAFYYAGNLSRAKKLFASYSINTDDRPYIEYQTPRGFRDVAAYDEIIWCVGPKLQDWIERIRLHSPLEDDPVWAGHPPEILHQVRSGTAFHASMVQTALGKDAEAEKSWELFLTHWRLGAR